MNVNFPFQLILEPTQRDLVPDEFKEELHVTLSKIKSGTILYKVHALSEPKAEKVHIGDLVITSEFTTSNFGDRYFFFKHQDSREDIKLRPEWKNDYPIYYPDLCPLSKAILEAL